MNKNKRHTIHFNNQEQIQDVISQVEQDQKVQSKEDYFQYLRQLDIVDSQKQIVAHLLIDRTQFKIKTGLNIVGRHELSDVCLEGSLGVSQIHAAIGIQLSVHTMHDY